MQQPLQTYVTQTILHVQEDDLPFCLELLNTHFTIPKSKKESNCLEVLPNYSKYKYSDKLPPFNEYDCVSEMELSTLECYNGYEIEASLNQFNDQILNDHLYMIFQKKGLETPTLIRKLVSSFVHHYKWPLTV